MSKTYLLIIGLILSSGLKSNAQTNEIVIDDLRFDWKIYDQETKLYLPYLSSVETNTVYFAVDSKKHQSFELKIVAGAGHFIFINSKLIDHLKQPVTIYYNIDSLVNSGHQKINISIYSKHFYPANVETKIIDRKREYNTAKSREMLTLSSRWTGNDNSDIFISLTIVLLGLILGYRTMNFRIFSEYFSLSNAVSTRQRFELITSQSLFSPGNLSFVLLYSIIVGSTALSISLFDNEFAANFGLIFGYVPKWATAILFTTLALTMMVGKRVLVFFVSGIFKFQKVRDLHFYTYLRASLILSVFAFLFSIFNGITEGELLEILNNHAYYIILSVLFIRLLLVYLVLISQLNFHKLQIFVYLCSTELIPLVFFLKIFLKQ